MGYIRALYCEYEAHGYISPCIWQIWWRPLMLSTHANTPLNLIWFMGWNHPHGWREQISSALMWTWERRKILLNYPYKSRNPPYHTTSHVYYPLTWISKPNVSPSFFSRIISLKHKIKMWLWLNEFDIIFHLLAVLSHESIVTGDITTWCTSVPSESIHTLWLIPHFVLQPEFKMDYIFLFYHTSTHIDS